MSRVVVAKILLASLALTQVPAASAAAMPCARRSMTVVSATLTAAGTRGTGCDHSMSCKVALCCPTSAPSLQQPQARVVGPTGPVFVALSVSADALSLSQIGPPTPPPKS